MVILTFERDPEVFRRALDSVAAQTLLPAEIIIADSGMDAGISERIREISRLNIDGVRARYVAVRDARAGNERNIASTHCTKGWIAFLDDEWYPDKLERQMAAVPEGTGPIASPYDLEAGGEVSRFVQDRGKISDGRSTLGENVIGCTSMQVADNQASRYCNKAPCTGRVCSSPGFPSG